MMLMSAPHTCHSLSLYPDYFSTRFYATLQNRSLNATCPNASTSNTVSATSSLVCSPITTVPLFHTAGTVGQLAHCITRTGTSRAVHIGEGFLANNIRPKINAIITLPLMVKFLNVLNKIIYVQLPQDNLV